VYAKVNSAEVIVARGGLPGGELRTRKNAGEMEQRTIDWRQGMLKGRVGFDKNLSAVDPNVGWQLQAQGKSGSGVMKYARRCRSDGDIQKKKDVIGKPGARPACLRKRHDSFLPGNSPIGKLILRRGARSFNSRLMKNAVEWVPHATLAEFSSSEDRRLA